LLKMINMGRNGIAKIEVLLIVLLACIPLFIRFPYRVNIFLSWEGAYRISQGQLPFRDFGIPLGGMYWVIPAIFFKLLGPKLITLIKAQVFINIVAGLSFRSILSSLRVNKGIRLASVLLFCISYSFFNFWPWYNHSVIVYELAGLAFLFRYMAAFGMAPEGTVVARSRYAWILVVLSGFFICCSFLTKQDGGGIAFLIAAILVACHSTLERKWMPLALFIGSFAVTLGLVVLVFSRYGFGYWFNHGQPPHNSRVSPFDIADEFFGSSQWIKFYFFLILVLALARFRRIADLLADRPTAFLLLLTLAILGEAAIFQVTSYTPPDNNIFFHSFAFACIFSLLSPVLRLDFSRARPFLVIVAGILLWWSGVYWKYAQRILERGKVRIETGLSASGENLVSKATYMINRDTTDVPLEKWVECGLPAFDRIYMPAPTVAGIHRLMDMEMIKRPREGSPGGGAVLPVSRLRVLNMSELTPLAVEIPFALERNSALPLWYHLGVGMFNRQADLFEDRIRDHYYDLVLFEYVPGLNNFYPFRVRDSLQVHYRLVDSFMAPRRGPDTKGDIEVYIRPAERPAEPVSSGEPRH
jgi:hypothetical protein